MVFRKKKKGHIFIVSAPSGTGKTTVIEQLANENSDDICRVITCTTREARGQEVDGRDYRFLSIEEFAEKVKKHQFLEHQEIFGHSYGTLKEDVEKEVDAGKHAFLVIDVQGAGELMGMIEAVTIFLMPPSIEELEKRIIGRKQDDKDAIKLRLSKAKGEMDQLNHYQYVVTNETVDEAVFILKAIVVAVEHLQ